MNRRRSRMRIEILEARSLLSGLTYNLTTDESSYQVGQPIQMTFTETNEGERMEWVPLSSVLELIDAGEIWNSGSLVALLRLMT